MKKTNNVRIEVMKKKIIITQEEEKLQRKCTLYMKYPFFGE
jgi:hypothetical protein